jgi:hypothetical protein
MEKQTTKKHTTQTDLETRGREEVSGAGNKASE